MNCNILIFSFHVQLWLCLLTLWPEALLLQTWPMHDFDLQATLGKTPKSVLVHMSQKESNSDIKKLLNNWRISTNSTRNMFSVVSGKCMETKLMKRLCARCRTYAIHSSVVDCGLRSVEWKFIAASVADIALLCSPCDVCRSLLPCINSCPSSVCRLPQRK